MRTVDVDARRYVWCQGQAVWHLSVPVAALLEELRGARADEQDGLARHCSRTLGRHCAVVLNLVLHRERPLPPAPMRAAWALDRVAAHPLGGLCLLLVRSPAELTAEELSRRAERLVAEVGRLVGDVPDPRSPDGYFPALAAAREWTDLAELVGGAGSLPREWTGARAR